MVNVIIICIIICAGAILIFHGINGIEKRAMKLESGNNKALEKYWKYMKWVDVVTGASIVLLGFSALINLVNGEQAEFIGCIICLASRILEYVIERKYIN